MGLIKKATPVVSSDPINALADSFYIDGDRVYVKYGDNVIYFAKSALGTVSDSDVVKGKTFSSSNGLKLTGTHVCDTSSAPVINAQADRIQYDYMGNVELYYGDHKITAPLSWFGDASRYDVVKGKTFTSGDGDGVAVDGLHECSADGLNILQRLSWAEIKKFVKSSNISTVRELFPAGTEIPIMTEYLDGNETGRQNVIYARIVGSFEKSTYDETSKSMTTQLPTLYIHVGVKLLGNPLNIADIVGNAGEPLISPDFLPEDFLNACSKLKSSGSKYDLPPTYAFYPNSSRYQYYDSLDKNKWGNMVSGFGVKIPLSGRGSYGEYYALNTSTGEIETYTAEGANKTFAMVYQLYI